MPPRPHAVRLPTSLDAGALDARAAAPARRAARAAERKRPSDPQLRPPRVEQARVAVRSSLT